MSTSGLGPEGPGPDASKELEAARRRLYVQGGRTPAAVAAYERLLEARRRAEAARPPAAPAETPGDARAVDGTPARSLRSVRRVLVVAAGGIALAAVVVLAVSATRPALPQQVSLPELGGTTLVAYDRPLDPATGPDSITYQPEGYTVFQPRGRTVAVALRCVGEGTVRISAGPQFDFRCTGQDHTFRQRDVGPRTAPFVIVGTTVGDVVWAARIVLLDPPQTAGAVPSFGDSCASCSVVGR